MYIQYETLAHTLGNKKTAVHIHTSLIVLAQVVLLLAQDTLWIQGLSDQNSTTKRCLVDTFSPRIAARGSSSILVQVVPLGAFPFR